MKVIIVSAVWCPSCLIMRPRYTEIRDRFSNIEFNVYDIDLDKDVSLYNVGDILPVFIIFDNNEKELARLTGEQSVEKLETLIKKYYL